MTTVKYPTYDKFTTITESYKRVASETKTKPFRFRHHKETYFR